MSEKKIIFFLDTPKFPKGPQSSAICPSVTSRSEDENGMGRWWNDNDMRKPKLGPKPVPVLLFAP
jgi:hypothetical protein